MQIDFPNHQGDIFKLRVLSDQNPNPKDIQLTVTKDRDNQHLKCCGSVMFGHFALKMVAMNRLSKQLMIHFMLVSLSIKQVMF